MTRLRAVSAAVAVGVMAALTLASASAQAAPARLCVLYFDNHTGDARWEPLKKGLADMMVTDLAGVAGVEVVERERLQDVLSELSLQRSSQFDPKTAQRLGKLVGARYAVTGAITAVAPKIRLDLRMIAVDTGKIVLADKVIGDPDAFFDLQQQLTRLFVNALGAATGTAPAAAAAAASRVEHLDTLLAFGEGLELADEGDDEAASKRFKEVVGRAPKFKLAQTRYAEVLRRLYAAKDKRKDALASGEQRLLAKCDAELARKPLAELTKRRDLERYLGYRILRGNLFLMQIKKATGSTSSTRATAIPAAKLDQVKAWMIGYRDNTRSLISELETLGRERTPSFPHIDDADRTLATELGGGSSPYEWSFMSPQNVARGLAGFLVLGASEFFCDVSIKVTPSLASLDPSYAAEATGLLDFALADIASHEEALKDRETVRALNLYGDILAALGRPIEAIARWQQILDGYPTCSEFADVEKKIRDALK